MARYNHFDGHRSPACRQADLADTTGRLWPKAAIYAAYIYRHFPQTRLDKVGAQLSPRYFFSFFIGIPSLFVLNSSFCSLLYHKLSLRQEQRHVSGSAMSLTLVAISVLGGPRSHHFDPITPTITTPSTKTRSLEWSGSISASLVEEVEDRLYVVAIAGDD